MFFARDNPFNPRIFFPPLSFVFPCDQQLTGFPLRTLTVPSDPPPATVFPWAARSRPPPRTTNPVRATRTGGGMAAQTGTSSSERREPPGTSSGCLHSSLSLSPSLSQPPVPKRATFSAAGDREENGRWQAVWRRQRGRRGETNDGSSGRDEEERGGGKGAAAR